MLALTCSGLVDAANAVAVVELVSADGEVPYWKDKVPACRYTAHFAREACSDEVSDLTLVIMFGEAEA